MTELFHAKKLYHCSKEYVEARCGGCQAEAELPVAALSELPSNHIARRTSKGERAVRAVSCFRRGRLLIVAAL